MWLKNWNLKFVLGKVENIVGKGENYHNVFKRLSKGFFLKVVKSRDCVVKS